MMSNPRLFDRFALLPALAVALVPAVCGQESGSVQPRGMVEIGVRGLAGDRDSAQFYGYRDLAPGVYIEQGTLDLDHLFSSNYFLNFQTRQSWQNDQHFLGGLGK